MAKKQQPVKPVPQPQQQPEHIPSPAHEALDFFVRKNFNAPPPSAEDLQMWREQEFRRKHPFTNA